MAFTARALGTAGAVPHGAFQKWAAQKLAGNRQLAEELLACLKCSIENYLHR
jgi:hypothetical protein